MEHITLHLNSCMVMRLTVDGRPAKYNHFEGVAFEGFNKENELLYTIFYSHLLKHAGTVLCAHITTFYPPGPSFPLPLSHSVHRDYHKAISPCQHAHNACSLSKHITVIIYILWKRLDYRTYNLK